MPRGDATHECTVQAFAGIRVEHRRPDGSVRLLAETTMLSVAQQAVARWAKRLRADATP